MFHCSVLEKNKNDILSEKKSLSAIFFEHQKTDFFFLDVFMFNIDAETFTWFESFTHRFAQISLSFRSRGAKFRGKLL